MILYYSPLEEVLKPKKSDFKMLESKFLKTEKSSLQMMIKHQLITFTQSEMSVMEDWNLHQPQLWQVDFWLPDCLMERQL